VVLTAAFGWRFALEQEVFIAPFMFNEDHATIFDPKRYESVTDRLLLMGGGPFSIVREIAGNNKPYIFKEHLDHKPPAYSVKYYGSEYEELPTDEPYVALSRLPRRTDFLHKVPANNQPPSEKRYSYVLPITRCIFDRLPFKTMQFAMFIPAIMHRLSVHMVADLLRKTILADVKFRDNSLVVAAISASSAFEETNYQRLEFLGDSILKTCTSLQLLGDHLLWHEGYLSAKKDRIVENSRLAIAALHLGLDKFILTKAFTGRKWRPMYLNEILSRNSLPRETRKISTKVLADVVEALIGAAIIDGGMPKALACMRVFLPEVNWTSLEYRREQIFEAVQEGVELPPPLEPLEELIGYTFSKKSLLIEAMTHASCKIGTGSYERLEFLGDSVLDNIVVTTVYSQFTELSHIQMHSIRTALVNADFLAFMCLEWAVTQETSSISENNITHSLQATSSTISLPLWRFMRHFSQALSSAQHKTSARHSVLRDDIKTAIEGGSHYPWVLLGSLQAPKFFSDIVESLLGAVYIDSGSFKMCKEVLERMGIMSYLRRIIVDEVHIIHPRLELGILADREKVHYEIWLEERIVNTVQTKEYICEVFVGDRSVVVVRGGVDKKEIKTKAADAAVKILKEQSLMKGIGLDGREDMLRKRQRSKVL
jgi:dsRNA-specific ribonuclease